MGGQAPAPRAEDKPSPKKDDTDDKEKPTKEDPEKKSESADENDEFAGFFDSISNVNDEKRKER